MDLTKLIQYLINMSIFDANTSHLGNASNAAVTVTLDAENGRRWNMGLVTVGYSATPTNGLLTIYEGANPIFQVPITSSGPTTVSVFRRGAGGNAMSAVLSAGGSGITGYVNVEAFKGV